MLYNGTRNIQSSTGTKTEVLERLYGDYNFKATWTNFVNLLEIALFKGELIYWVNKKPVQ